MKLKKKIVLFWDMDNVSKWKNWKISLQLLLDLITLDFIHLDTPQLGRQDYSKKKNTFPDFCLLAHFYCAQKMASSKNYFIGQFLRKFKIFNFLAKIGVL